MATFSVNVVQIEHPVEHHPDADRLSLIRIGGYICISAKNADGSHRYRQGDLVVYVPEGAIIPEWLLRQGFWDEAKGKGILAGSNGDRVKAIRLRGVTSQGILFPVNMTGVGTGTVTSETGELLPVTNESDVAAFLNIQKYEPPIPVAMAGEVLNLFGVTEKYDFESIQKITDLFSPGDLVEATEKIHGTCFQFGYVPGLNNPECFFDGCLYTCSKGIGAQGLALKNNEANASNTYVRTLKGLLENGFGERIRDLAIERGAPVRVFAEIFGAGIQDLSYGAAKPSVLAFDIKIGDEFLARDEFIAVSDRLRLGRVPVLYSGPFDEEALKAYRDGKDTLSGSHMREGIVIRSNSESPHPIHGRRIAKWVSPDYLLRKNATEFA